MDFADQGDLASEVKGFKTKNALMPETRIWEIFTDITKGLRDLHKHKIMHRDIKCANIFVYEGGKAKIGDLNVSKLQKVGLAKTQTGTP